MQHIIQFAFDFEDDRIRKSIEQNIENQIVSNIESQLNKQYFEKRWGDNPVENMVSESVKKIMSENKDKIIQTTARMLCERLVRKKGFAEQVLEEMKESEEN